MKKLSQYKNEDALDILADILDPAISIMGDPKLAASIKRNDNKLKIAKLILKDHKKEIITIMAVLNNTPVEDYEFNIITGLRDVLDILNDEELVGFFQSQSQSVENVSGDATPNTKVTETT